MVPKGSRCPALKWSPVSCLSLSLCAGLGPRNIVVEIERLKPGSESKPVVYLQEIPGFRPPRLSSGSHYRYTCAVQPVTLRRLELPTAESKAALYLYLLVLVVTLRVALGLGDYLVP